MKLKNYLKESNFNSLIQDFFKYLIKEQLEIYNEFSFQHELGIYLRKLDKNREYKIELERNIKSILSQEEFKSIIENERDLIEGKTKREIDIYIENKTTKEKYAIELKYPKNGEYPNQMFKFLKDIKIYANIKKS